jgi:hypothetical protein
MLQELSAALLPPHSMRPVSAGTEKPLLQICCVKGRREEIAACRDIWSGNVM